VRGVVAMTLVANLNHGGMLRFHLCLGLHFLQEPSRHVENKSSHWDIFGDPGM
jgi:hypothetical protein